MKASGYGCEAGRDAWRPPRLERDDFKLNRHRALELFVEHDLFGKPASTFPDHALTAWAVGGVTPMFADNVNKRVN